MDFDQLYPNRFMKAGEFDGREVTLIISAIELEELEGDKGLQTKAVVSFQKTKKQLVLNKTNGTCLKAMFGRETDPWIGKRVTFYPVEVESFGEATLAIRIKGSPDIGEAVKIDTKIGRRKLKVTMVPTGKKNGKAAQAELHDTTTGEVLGEEPGAEG